MKSSLPAVIHDHFRKANALHAYVEEHLGKAKEYALGTGRELLEAKKAIQHGEWEKECGRLFDGSLRTAQFYMEFAKNISAIPKAQASALLNAEDTLEGAAKAAKNLAKPVRLGHSSNGRSSAARTGDECNHEGGGAAEEEQASDDTETTTEGVAGEDYTTEGFESDEPEDYGVCPNCKGKTWVDDEFGICCAKCKHPYGEAVGDVDDDRIATQRSKTVKTGEALLRAFDDLHGMLPRKEHGSAETQCKALIRMAKEWK